MAIESAPNIPAPPPSLWRHRDFMLFWLAQTASQVGTQITFIAVPLIAIRSLHASPLAIGALNALDFAPAVVVGLYAGAVVDRLRRRPVMITADIARAVALASVPIAYLVHALTLAQLLALTVIVGAVSVFFDVAYQTYVPFLVARGQLVDANSKLELSRSGGQVGGAALAGALIQAVTAPYAILVDSASFLASAISLRAIRAEEPGQAGDAIDGPTPPKMAEIRDGIRFVIDQHPLRFLALSAATSNLGLAIVEALILIYAARSLGLDAAVIGLIFAVGNLGIAAAATAAPRLVRRIGTGRAIAVGAAMEAIGLALIPAARSWWAVPLLATAQIVRTFGIVTFNITQVSLRQLLTPEDRLGRVNATMRVIAWSLIPLGALTGGALGTTLGIRTGLIIGAAMCAVALVPALHPSLRHYESAPAAQA